MLNLPRSLQAIVLMVFVIAAGSVWAEQGEQAAQEQQKEIKENINTSAATSTCNHYTPSRQAFFGDLHIHTSLSLDAEMQGTRVTPYDAYQYIQGGEIGLPPYNDKGEPARTARLERPLDFAAVSDHAELLGETYICNNEGEEGYSSFACALYRFSPRKMGIVFNKNSSEGKRLGFCGDDGELCVNASLTPWQQTQEAAEKYYDRSADCSFTSFVGYEWTAGAFPEGGLVANLHRNVIFKNETVPEFPISTVEAKNASQLWKQLDEHCVNAEGDCDVVVIPHNSNLSVGLMFETGLPEEDLQRQKRLEPLVEMIQHKGSSECFYGGYGMIAADELCSFEQLPWNSFSGNTFSFLQQPPSPDDGFIREVLRDGLRLEQDNGFNPFKFGFIGSTDTHRGMAGGVEEKNYVGHGGAGNEAPGGKIVGLPDQWEFNPGGLAVLYAEENTRESLFAAMQRKETYATSGPRIGVRFFAGEDIPENLCEQGDLVEQGYAQGVPMGGNLPAMSDQSGPRFVVAASKDPGTASNPGNDLQRIQIIKGWVDEKGESRESVVDIAGDANNGASVDLNTCQPQGEGFKQLCEVWQDKEFNPDQQAYYYARVVENPSCRWNTYVCNAQQVDCSKPSALSDAEALCCADHIPKTIQERAWTSPVWYSPES